MLRFFHYFTASLAFLSCGTFLSVIAIHTFMQPLFETIFCQCTYHFFAENVSLAHCLISLQKLQSKSSISVCTLFKILLLKFLLPPFTLNFCHILLLCLSNFLPPPVPLLSERDFFPILPCNYFHFYFFNTPTFSVFQ